MAEKDLISYTALVIVHMLGKHHCCWDDKYIVLVLKRPASKDVAIGNAPVDTYGKCGDIKDAIRALVEIQVKNVISWASLLAADGRHGFGNVAVALYRQMESKGLKPNDVTLLSLLFACSHSGLTSEGWDCFTNMISEYSIVPRAERFSCSVDLSALRRNVYITENEQKAASQELTTAKVQRKVKQKHQMAPSDDGGHIVMLPLMAHGHLVPFLALARRIRRRSRFAVTIASTPVNVRRLRSAAVADPTLAAVDFAELAFHASDHGLPTDVESTENMPLTQMAALCYASLSLRAPLESLVASITCREGGRPPVCIISDIFFGWAVDVAKAFGTRSYSLTTCGAYGTSAYVSLWLNLPHQRCLFDKSRLVAMIREADGDDLWSRYLRPQFELTLNSSGWLCNTNLVKLPVWTIGPLLPDAIVRNDDSSGSLNSISEHQPEKPLGITPERCVEFLDAHPPSAVVYVCFGSQNTITESNMKELAAGLEASERPFIWVMRPPLGFDMGSEIRDEWLPPGFKERLTRVEKKRGLLVRDWAPQLEILRHGSTGAFLSHCGWNSTMESLSQGVPIIGWPMAGEQAYNVKMMVEEMGVCVELARGAAGDVSREEVRRAIEAAMDAKRGKGKELRERATKVREKIRRAAREGEGSSDKAMDEFLRNLVVS
ncbi:hypothetical protein NL676_022500 [Syzygium grande]|nr:hypothetical protein NL676_022500 [Syzygium grande]